MSKQATQVGAKVATHEYTYEPPAHVRKSQLGSTSHDNVDIFEFVCSPEWHQPFVKHSFDRSDSRDHPIRNRLGTEVCPGIVQIGALISLVCGLSSWVYKNHVFIDMNALRVVRPVTIGDKIRLIFEALEVTPVKRLRIRIELADDPYKYTECVDDGIVICDDEVRIAPFPARRLKRK